jgi:hypothetical protein
LTLLDVAILLLAAIVFNVFGFGKPVFIPVAAVPFRPVFGGSTLVVAVIRIDLAFLLLPDSLAFALASGIGTHRLLGYTGVWFEGSTTDQALALGHGICRPTMLPTPYLQIFRWNLVIVT